MRPSCCMAMATALWATSLGAQPAPARPDPASWSVWESADGVFRVDARCSVLDTDDRSRAGEIREITPFASWFARGHDLKLQADFSLRTTRLADGSSLDERRFRSALVVLF